MDWYVLISIVRMKANNITNFLKRYDIEDILYIAVNGSVWKYEYNDAWVYFDVKTATYNGLYQTSA